MAGPTAVASSHENSAAATRKSRTAPASLDKASSTSIGRSRILDIVEIATKEQVGSRRGRIAEQANDCV